MKEVYYRFGIVCHSIIAVVTIQLDIEFLYNFAFVGVHILFQPFTGGLVFALKFPLGCTVLKLVPAVSCG